MTLNVHLQICLYLRPSSQALLSSVTGGMDSPSPESCNSGYCGGKPPLKASLLASNGLLLPSCLVEKKP